MKQGNQNNPIGKEDLNGSAIASPALRAPEIDGLYIYGWDLDPDKAADGRVIPPHWKAMFPMTDREMRGLDGVDTRIKQAEIRRKLDAHDALVKALQLVLETIDLEEYAAMKAEMVAALALASQPSPKGAV